MTWKYHSARLVHIARAFPPTKHMQHLRAAATNSVFVPKTSVLHDDFQRLMHGAHSSNKKAVKQL